MSMRRIVTIDGTGQIAVQEEETPELKANMVLVEVKSCLVSPGTELGGVRRMRENPNPDEKPRPFGYGNAGVVLEVGEGCENIEPGMRLACMGGYASHASQVVVPINLTVPIPEGLSFDEASFAHLAATALNAVRRSQIEFGQNVLVMGLGIVGQIASQMARASGAHVMAADRLPMRLEKAAECGADVVVNNAEENLAEKAEEFTRGYGIDAVIMAFGGDGTEAIKQAQAVLKETPDGHKMGCIVIVGGLKFETQFPTDFGNVDIRASSRPGPGYHDEKWEYGDDYPPVFVQWTTKRNLEESLRFAADGRLKLNSLITHRMPLDEAPQGCEELISNPNQAMGVVLHP